MSSYALASMGRGVDKDGLVLAWIAPGLVHKPSIDSPTKTNKDEENSPNPNKSSLRNSVNRVDTDDLEQGEKKRPHTAN